MEGIRDITPKGDGNKKAVTLPKKHTPRIRDITPKGDGNTSSILSKCCPTFKE